MTVIAPRRNRRKGIGVVWCADGGSLELLWNTCQVQRIRCVATTAVSRSVSSFIVIGECDFAQAIA
jgi:hypothetical protein